mgnify:CR=1 FL=1
MLRNICEFPLVEKEGSVTGYGQADFIIKKNQKVLIVEDVITTGKSSLECSKLVQDNGATTIGFACIIDRSNDKSSIKDKIVSQVKLNIPTYTDKNLPKELLALKAVKPGSRNL